MQSLFFTEDVAGDAGVASNTKNNNLFLGKRVLDIGCHTGAVALQIAALYNPAIVIGCDIDHRLVKTAIENIHKAINDDEVSLFLKKA